MASDIAMTDLVEMTADELWEEVKKQESADRKEKPE